MHEERPVNLKPEKSPRPLAHGPDGFVHAAPPAANWQGRPAGPPLATGAGRSFALWDAGVELWVPEPPRDGDPVYCRGVCVGTVRGDLRKAGEGRLDLAATEHFTPEVAAKILAGGEA